MFLELAFHNGNREKGRRNALVLVPKRDRNYLDLTESALLSLPKGRAFYIVGEFVSLSAAIKRLKVFPFRFG